MDTLFNRVPLVVNVELADVLELNEADEGKNCRNNL